jgi:outer membrane protein, heavy metal efflux system
MHVHHHRLHCGLWLCVGNFMRIRSSPASRYPALLILIVSAATVAAEPPDPRGELTLTQVVALALSRNPELQSTDYELRAADARTVQAGLRPNPEMGVQVENFASSAAVRTVQPLQTTLTLSQVIELGGKRSRRVDVAQRGRDALAIERDIRQLDVLAEVTRRFVDVVADQEQLSLGRRAAELAERTLNAMTARVTAARSPEAEKARASIAFDRARLEQQHAEYELQSSRRMLAALWGSTEALFGVARADLYAMPPADTFEALAQRLKHSPDFLRFTAESRLREADLRLAQAQATPNVQFNAGIRHFNGLRDPALVAGFSLPLPLFDRNQGAIREAEVRHDQVRVDERAAYIKANATLFELYQAVQQARLETRTLREQVIPKAEHALAQTEYGFQRGRFSYLELANAQRDLIEVQRAAIEAAANHYRLAAEIERLTGEPVTPTDNENSP